MLRISLMDGDDIVILKLEGKASGPWATELDQEWATFAPSLGRRKLCLDLCDLTFADNQGIEILRNVFRTTRAEILASSLFSRYVADEVRQQPNPNTRRTVQNAKSLSQA